MKYLAFNSKRNSSRNTIFKAMFLTLIIGVFFIVPSFSQQAREYNQFLNSLGESEKQEVEDLFFGGKSQVFVGGGKVKVFGDSDPKVLFLEPSSVKDLGLVTTGGSSIQGISVHLGTDSGASNFKLNANEVAQFTALKYILVVSDQPINSASIGNMISGFTNSEVIILYQYSEPQ